MLKFYIDSNGSQGVGIAIWDTKHRYVQSTSTTGSNLASVTSVEVTGREAKTIHRLLA